MWDARDFLIKARLEIAGDMEVSCGERAAWVTLVHATDYIISLREGNTERAVAWLEANGFKVSVNWDDFTLRVEEKP